MTMSKYTLELRNILADPNFELFDFEYQFYNDAAKLQFQEIFKDYYYYYEIGSETVARFKHNLKTKLNLIAPYYKQLYQTELATDGISFLLNKDLEETFTRELVNDNILNGSTNNINDIIVNNNNNSNSTTSYNGTNDSLYKESSIDNGVADVNLTNNNLTTVNNTVDNVNNSNNVENTAEEEIITKNTSENTTNNIINNTTTEKTSLISKGNIGTTSSAKLLEEWRNVLININQLIIEECKELFMGVY